MRSTLAGVLASIAVLLALQPGIASPTDGYNIEQRDTSSAQSTMCNWQNSQSALVRDTIYLYGGFLVLQAPSGPQINWTTELFSLNLTQPFAVTDLPSQTIQSGAGPEQFPWSKGGHMLANDYEFILYGGVVQATDAGGTSGITIPAGNEVTSKELYQHDPTPLTDPGAWLQLDTGKVSWYVTGGGYTSVPSENTAYVFGGSRSKNWGEILWEQLNETYFADELSSQLISVDMTTMRGEKWTNTTIPDDIPARANGELVWLPVGDKGTLVAIGGTVLDQNYIDGETKTSETDQTKLEKQNLNLMKNVTLYDISGGKWYTQETTGAIPNGTAEFCSFVAASQDGSSHQIYIYGGAPDVGSQTSDAETFSDDVYILSIPSFIWTKAYTGTSDSARKGHRCQKVSNNQAIVIGGLPSAGGVSCFSGDFVKVFDLNELKFVDNYDPAAAIDYKVPDVVSKVIGGDASGGATATPGTWSSKDLSTLLAAPYKGTIKEWWPYKSANASNGTSDDSPTTAGTPDTAHTTSSSNTGSSLPSYVPPLLGAILGLLVLIAILCLVLFILRRRRLKMKKLQSDSAVSTAEGARNHRTWSWLMGHGVDPEKPPVLDSFDHTPQTEPTDYFSNDGTSTTLVGAFSPDQEKRDPLINELPEDTVHELPGDARAQELPSHRERGIKVNFQDGVEEIGPSK